MYSNIVELKYIAKGVNQRVPSKGLGDTIEKITKATGIKAVVDKVSEITGVDCGCSARKDTLNEIFPYKK